VKSRRRENGLFPGGDTESKNWGRDRVAKNRTKRVGFEERFPPQYEQSLEKREAGSSHVQSYEEGEWFLSWGDTESRNWGGNRAAKNRTKRVGFEERLLPYSIGAESGEARSWKFTRTKLRRGRTVSFLGRHRV